MLLSLRSSPPPSLPSVPPCRTLESTHMPGCECRGIMVSGGKRKRDISYGFEGVGVVRGTQRMQVLGEGTEGVRERIGGGWRGGRDDIKERRGETLGGGSMEGHERSKRRKGC